MKKYYLITLSLIFFFQCNNKRSERLLRDDIIADRFSFFITQIIDPYFSDYDICGKFNDEFPDSLILKSLSFENLDTIIKNDDVEYILDQYNRLKGKSVEQFIQNIDEYERKEGATYSRLDSLKYHFSISPPLLTKNNEYWLIFVVGYSVSLEDSYKDGFYFLFKTDQDKITLIGRYKNSFTTPSNENHIHGHSYLPKKL